jgi:hypothetical protein
MLSRPEVGTREHILLWLAGKDPDAEYQWENPQHCPCGQYGREYVTEWVLPISLLAELEPHTWGALYQRAYKAAW